MTYWDNRHEPIVYYMVHEDYRGAVKIGTTVNQHTRIAKYCNAKQDRRYFIVAKERGDAKLEKIRQQEFSEYCISKDWFFFNGALKDHVLSLAAIGFEPEKVQES